MPTTEISEEDLFNGTIDVIAMLVKSGLVPSRSEGRRAIEQGGVMINDDKVTDIKKAFTLDEIASREFILKRGKKNFKKIVVK